MSLIDPSVPLPSSDDELILLAQGGSERAKGARGLLLDRYEPLFKSVIRELRTDLGRPDAFPDLHQDMLQSARMGFLEALDRFDRSYGASIGTYARKFVEGEVRRLIRGEIDYACHTLPIEDVIVSDSGQSEEDQMTWQELLGREDPAYESVDQEEAYIALRDFVETLSGSQQYLITEVYWNRRTQADVARELGITRAAVNKSLKRAREYGKIRLWSFA